MAFVPLTGLQKIEGKHSDRVNQMVKDTIDRLKEVYGESVPQPILDQIEYIIKESYKQAYVYGFNDCYWEAY